MDASTSSLLPLMYTLSICRVRVKGEGIMNLHNVSTPVTIEV
jgi:hypothetical protein